MRAPKKLGVYVLILTIFAPTIYFQFTQGHYWPFAGYWMFSKKRPSWDKFQFYHCEGISEDDRILPLNSYAFNLPVRDFEQSIDAAVRHRKLPETMRDLLTAYDAKRKREGVQKPGLKGLRISKSLFDLRDYTGKLEAPTQVELLAEVRQ
jgi:hypothetical protein